jgi:hypothetical protein
MAKKKKLKKLLKGLGIGAALLGAGKALMSARDRKAMLNSASADDGFGFMKMKDFGPYSTKRGFVPVNMMTPQDMADDPMFMGAMAKKGGRIKKTKKGGRAVRKANRSMKK